MFRNNVLLSYRLRENIVYIWNCLHTILKTDTTYTWLLLFWWDRLHIFYLGVFLILHLIPSTAHGLIVKFLDTNEEIRVLVDFLWCQLWNSEGLPQVSTLRSTRATVWRYPHCQPVQSRNFQITKFGTKCSSLYIKTLKMKVCVGLGYINIQIKIGADLKKNIWLMSLGQDC